MGLGTVVRDLRHDQELTIEQLADEAGVGTATISRLELYEMVPSVRVLDKIAGALGTTAGTLITESEKPKRKRAKAAR